MGGAPSPKWDPVGFTNPKISFQPPVLLLHFPEELQHLAPGVLPLADLQRGAVAHGVRAPHARQEVQRQPTFLGLLVCLVLLLFVFFSVFVLLFFSSFVAVVVCVFVSFVSPFVCPFVVFRLLVFPEQIYGCFHKGL